MGDFSFRNQWSPFKIDGKKWHRIGGFVSLQFVATACGPQFESFNPILFCTHFVSPSTMFACVACTPVLTHQACFLWRVVAWDEKMLLEEVVEEPVGPGVWRHALHSRVAPTGSWLILLWLWVIPNLLFFIFYSQLKQLNRFHSTLILYWFGLVLFESKCSSRICVWSPHWRRILAFSRVR